MTLPQQEHNSLLATREFLIDLMNSEKIADVPEKVRLSARALLKHYPSKLRLDELYAGKTFSDTVVTDENDITEQEIENNNKIYNIIYTIQTLTPPPISPEFRPKPLVHIMSKNPFVK